MIVRSNLVCTWTLEIKLHFLFQRSCMIFDDFKFFVCHVFNKRRYILIKPFCLLQQSEVLFELALLNGHEFINFLQFIFQLEIPLLNDALHLKQHLLVLLLSLFVYLIAHFHNAAQNFNQRLHFR